MRRNALCLMVLFLVNCGSAWTQEPEIESEIIDLTPTPEGDMQQLVTARMEKARRGEPSYILGFGKRSDEAIPYLQHYIKDPNDKVRLEVALIASASHTEGATKILATLVGDTSSFQPNAIEPSQTVTNENDNVGVVTNENDGDTDSVQPNPSSEAADHAVRTLYTDYERQEIVQRGGSLLKNNLMKFVQRNRPMDVKGAILLLSCFKADRGVISFLKDLRRRYAAKTQRGTEAKMPSAVDPGDPALVEWELNAAKAKLIPTIDIALSELGEPNAIERMKGYIAKGEIKHLLLMFDTIKFINDRAILSRLVELLKDKRNATVYQLSHSRYRVNLRVCDVTLAALDNKTGVNTSLYRRFSNAELSEAYARLKNRFGAK